MLIVCDKLITISAATTTGPDMIYHSYDDFTQNQGETPRVQSRDGCGHYDTTDLR